MSKRFKTVSWYCPGFVAGYDKDKTVEESLETTTLVAFNDIGPDTYIPVFNSQAECDRFVSKVANTHGDLAFTICKFHNLAELHCQVKEEFEGQSIKIVIKESNTDEV